MKNRLPTILILLTACTMLSCSPTLPDDPPGNPLSECPGTPNCVRTAIVSNKSAADCISHLMDVLKDMGAHSLESTDENAIDAVFRIPVFGWKDDVNLLVKEQENGTTIIYIRSASRVGHSDLGVNARRVNKLIKRFEGMGGK